MTTIDPGAARMFDALRQLDQLQQQRVADTIRRLDTHWDKSMVPGHAAFEQAFFSALDHVIFEHDQGLDRDTLVRLRDATRSYADAAAQAARITQDALDAWHAGTRLPRRTTTTTED